MKIHEIYLDMDGVLFDFFYTALDLYSKTYQFDKKNFVKNYPVGRDGLPQLLGLTKAEFWAIINKDQYFWTRLPVLPKSRFMVNFCEAFADTHILTKPNRSPASYSGKKEALDRHFPELDVYMAKDKSKLSAQGRVLIDDKNTNIDDWRDWGGIGILYPQVWNRNYAFSDTPVEYVCSVLAQYAQMHIQDFYEERTKRKEGKYGEPGYNCI